MIHYLRFYWIVRGSKLSKNSTLNPFWHGQHVAVRFLFFFLTFSTSAENIESTYGIYMSRTFQQNATQSLGACLFYSFLLAVFNGRDVLECAKWQWHSSESLRFCWFASFCFYIACPVFKTCKSCCQFTERTRFFLFCFLFHWEKKRKKLFPSILLSCDEPCHIWIIYYTNN